MTQRPATPGAPQPPAGGAAPPDEATVTSTWVETRLAVSIKCATYNHVEYLEQTLSGFLGQVTTFPFEIIVHDDASTDGTTDVLRSFTERYPRIIKPIIQSENQYSRGVQPGPAMDALASGEYLAMCEGDDYWTDPGKLARQVALLDTRPEFVCSFHDAFAFDVTGVVEPSLVACKRDLTRQELLRVSRFMPTATLLYRAGAVDNAPEKRLASHSDVFLRSTLGRHGAAAYQGDEIDPAAYRRHPGGIWSSLDRPAQQFQRANTLHQLINYYSRVGGHDDVVRHFRLEACKHLLGDDPREIVPLLGRLSWFGLRRIRRRLTEGRR